MMKKNLNRLAAALLALTMALALCACSQPAADNSAPPAASTAPSESPDESPVPTEEAPDPDDLTVVRSLELQYANNFSVDYCANGCKIITDGGERKFLLVPEGGPGSCGHQRHDRASGPADQAGLLLHHPCHAVPRHRRAG